MSDKFIWTDDLVKEYARAWQENGVSIAAFRILKQAAPAFLFSDLELSDEQWSEIPSCVGKYAVSSLGRFKSLKTGLILRPHIMNGYNNISLSGLNGRTKFRNARVVAKAFCPNPLNKPMVNHIDGDKRNDRASNLEWVTNQENSIHAHETGLTRYPLSKPYVKKGEDGIVCIHSRPVNQFSMSGKLIAVHSSIKEAAESVGAKSPSISNVLVNKRGKRTCKGFIWTHGSLNKIRTTKIKKNL